MIQRGNNPAGWIFASKNVCGFRDRQDDPDKGISEEEVIYSKQFIQTLKQANV